MSTPLLSDTLQQAARRLEDLEADDFTTFLRLGVHLSALIDVLEHAAVLAAEHEYTASHSTVRSDYAGVTTTRYPPLVRLLAIAVGSTQ